MLLIRMPAIWGDGGLSVPKNHLWRVCSNMNVLKGKREVILRQEVDGAQAEHLESVSCGQILQDKIMTGSRRIWVLLWYERKRAHISHSWGQGDLPPYTCAEKFLRGQRREGAPGHNTFCQLPRDPHAGIHLGYKMCVHTGKDPEPDQIWTQSQTKQDDWPEETQKNCPHISDLIHLKSTWLFFWAHLCVYPHIHFFS